MKSLFSADFFKCHGQKSPGEFIPPAVLCLFFFCAALKAEVEEAQVSGASDKCRDALISQTEESDKVLQYRERRALAREYMQAWEIDSVKRFFEIVLEDQPEGVSLSIPRDFKDEFEGWSVFLGLETEANPRPPRKKRSSPKRRNPKLSGRFRQSIQQTPQEENVEAASFSGKRRPPTRHVRGETKMSKGPSPFSQAPDGGIYSAPSRRGKLLSPADVPSQEQLEALLLQHDILTKTEYDKWRKTEGAVEAARPFHLPGYPTRLNFYDFSWRRLAKRAAAAGGRKIRTAPVKREDAPSQEQFEVLLLQHNVLTRTEYDRWKETEAARQFQLSGNPTIFYSNFSWRKFANKIAASAAGISVWLNPADAPSQEQFEALLLQHNVLTQTEYDRWKETGAALEAAGPAQLPVEPETFYRNFSWKKLANKAAGVSSGRKTKAATVKRENAPSQEQLEALLLQHDILTQREYSRWRKTKAALKAVRPYQLPFSPPEFYRDFKWRSLAERAAAAGGRKIKAAPVKRENALPQEQLEALLLQHDILTEITYGRWRKTEGAVEAARPYQLPSIPREFYRDFNWRSLAERAAAADGRTIGAAPIKRENAPSQEQLEVLLLQHSVLSRRRYERWRKTEEALRVARPFQLPSDPEGFYRDFNWSRFAKKAAAADAIHHK